MPFVYALFDKKTDNIFYIGKTKQKLKNRFNYHVYQVKNTNSQNVHRYIKENSIDFDIKIIEECSIEQLTQKEHYWINHYGTTLQNISIYCVSKILCKNCNKWTQRKNQNIDMCYNCYNKTTLNDKNIFFNHLDNKIDYNGLLLQNNIENFIKSKKRSDITNYNYRLELNKIDFLNNDEESIYDMILNDDIWKSLSVKKKVTCIVIMYFDYLNIKIHKLHNLFEHISSLIYNYNSQFLYNTYQTNINL